MSPAAVISPVFTSQVAPRGLLSAVRGIAQTAFRAESNNVAGISLRIIRMPGFVQNAIGSHQASGSDVAVRPSMPLRRIDARASAVAVRTGIGTGCAPGAGV